MPKGASNTNKKSVRGNEFELKLQSTEILSKTKYKSLPYQLSYVTHIHIIE